jgi:hypothetical protein
LRPRVILRHHPTAEYVREETTGVYVTYDAD